MLCGMTEWIWLNGETLPLSDARLGIEDRGFQFADGVYEVIRIYNGKLFTAAEHLDRLERSCDGISMAMPMAKNQLAGEITKLVTRSGVTDGMVYLQLTRGQCTRNHLFP